MARPKPPKKKPAAKAKRGVVNSAERRLVAALADNYAIVRYFSDENSEKMDEWSGIFTPCNQHMASLAENFALIKPFQWRAFVITFCRDQFGKEYRLLSYGESQQMFIAWAEGAKPFMRKVLEFNEKNLNPKHLIGRALIISVKGQRSVDAFRILKTCRKQAHLSDDDIHAFLELVDENNNEMISFETFNDLEIEDRIRVLMNEIDYERSVAAAAS